MPSKSMKESEYWETTTTRVWLEYRRLSSKKQDHRSSCRNSFENCFKTHIATNESSEACIWIHESDIQVRYHSSVTSHGWYKESTTCWVPVKVITLEKRTVASLATVTSNSLTVPSSYGRVRSKIPPPNLLEKHRPSLWPSIWPSVYKKFLEPDCVWLRSNCWWTSI